MSISRFVGCIVGSAMGDALGASFEGSLSVSSSQDIHFGGRWTDDTHMMIGMAESLIANKGFSADHMAQTFMSNWEKQPWRGYGPGPPRIFKMMKLGVPWQDAAKQLYDGTGSYGNGAAMRVAPIGILYHNDKEKLRETAIMSAEITHTHKLGKEGAAIQAYAVSLALQTETNTLNPETFLEKIIDFTKNESYKAKLKKAKHLLPIQEKREITRQLGNSIEALNSVPTAIYCFAKNHQDYTKAVSYAVSLGGDTDTIGAMTGAISGAFHGQEKLPPTWKQKLEKSEYLSDLAQKLWKLKTSFSNQNHETPKV